MPDSASGIEQFAVSGNGVLAYVAGERTVVKRADRDGGPEGRFTTVTADASAYEDLALSPDGREIAMTVEGPSWNIWVYHIDRGTLTRLTFDNDNRDPSGRPTGDGSCTPRCETVSTASTGGAADGSGPEELLDERQELAVRYVVVPRRPFPVVRRAGSEDRQDLWILPVGGDRKPYPFVNTSFREWFGEFSRDGRWIAYESNESGRSEIYLRPFPGPGGKWQVSTQGGARPEWSRDGKELFFFEADRLMRVTVDTGPSLAVGRPELLFPCNCFDSGRYYEVTPDDKHFVLIQERAAGGPRHPDQSRTRLGRRARTADAREAGTMTLAAGSRLGPYEILAPIGAGGMGEVYRAKDPRLGRDVAIKVLPASFSSRRGPPAPLRAGGAEPPAS